MTTREAAESLGLSVRQVQALIKSGRIKAVKPEGSDAWDVDISDYKPRTPGRPKGSKNMNLNSKINELAAQVIPAADLESFCNLPLESKIVGLRVLAHISGDTETEKALAEVMP